MLFFIHQLSGPGRNDHAYYGAIGGGHGKRRGTDSQILCDRQKEYGLASHCPIMKEQHTQHTISYNYPSVVKFLPDHNASPLKIMCGTFLSPMK